MEDLGLLDFAIPFSRKGVKLKPNSTQFESTLVAYIVTASQTVEAYELDAVNISATHLWSLPVDLYGAQEQAFRSNLDTDPTAQWPATVAVNSKYLMVQSEKLWVYPLNLGPYHLQPSGGRQITSMDSICGGAASWNSCGQIAFGVQENVAFSLAHENSSPKFSNVFRIDLEDTNSALLEVFAPVKLSSINLGMTASVPVTGMAVEQSVTEHGSTTFIYLHMVGYDGGQMPFIMRFSADDPPFAKYGAMSSNMDDSTEHEYFYDGCVCALMTS